GRDIVSSIAGYPDASLFYNYISTAMPANAPGSLTDQQYVDIVAYLLAENGHPTGTEELPADTEVLAQIDPSTADGAADEQSSAEPEADAAADDAGEDEPAAEQPAAGD